MNLIKSKDINIILVLDGILSLAKRVVIMCSRNKVKQLFHVRAFLVCEKQKGLIKWTFSTAYDEEKS